MLTPDSTISPDNSTPPISPPTHSSFPIVPHVNLDIVGDLNQVPTPPPSHSMVTRLKDGIRKPNPKYAFHSSLTNEVTEPTSYTKAVKHASWRHVMQEELTVAKEWHLEISSS